MLFLGSSRFPAEGELDKFLSQHHGYSNASTELEYTVYGLEVDPHWLEGAMERLAHFFVAPLLRTPSASREVHAIDSEFANVQQSDGCRLNQVKCHTAQPGHRYRKFTWGNLKSLTRAVRHASMSAGAGAGAGTGVAADSGADSANSDAAGRAPASAPTPAPAPASSDDDDDDDATGGGDRTERDYSVLRPHLCRLFCRGYHASTMTVCVVGMQPLDELEAMTRRCFSAVPANASERRSQMAQVWGAAASTGASDDEQMSRVANASPAAEDALHALLGSEDDALGPEPDSELSDASPFAPEQSLGHLFRVGAIRHGCAEVHLTFPLPPIIGTPGAKPAPGEARASPLWNARACDALRGSYEHKPDDVVAHVLGHEGRGSLLSMLRRHGLAESLMAGVGDSCYDSNSGCALFEVMIKLTEAGEERWREVVGAVFAFLRLMLAGAGSISAEATVATDVDADADANADTGASAGAGTGPPWLDWVYEELAKVNAMRYRFQEEQESWDYAEALSVAMQRPFGIADEDILRWQFVFRRQPQTARAITELLMLLVPKNARVDLLSSRVAAELGTSTSSGAVDNAPDTAPTPVKPAPVSSGGASDALTTAWFGAGPGDDVTSNAVQTEPWFDCRYVSVKLPDALLAAWTEGPRPLAHTDEAAPASPNGSLRHREAALAAAWSSELRLPTPNPLIAENFDVAPLQPSTEAAEAPPVPASASAQSEGSDTCGAAATSVPQLVVAAADGMGVDVWYKQDDVFRQPKLAIKIVVASKAVQSLPDEGDDEACEDDASDDAAAGGGEAGALDAAQTEALAAVARAAVNSTLYVKVARELLGEFAYDAELAELHYHLGATDLGASLSFSGFSDKLLELMKTVTSLWAAMPLDTAASDAGDTTSPTAVGAVAADTDGMTPNVTPERVRTAFAMSKTVLIRQLRNNYLQPTVHATAMRMLLLMPHRVPLRFLLRAARRSNLSQLARFQSAFFRSFSVEALLHGNAVRDKAHELARLLHGIFLQRIPARSAGATPPRAPPAATFSTRPSLRIAQLANDDAGGGGGARATDRLLWFDTVNPDEPNSSVVMYFQIGRGYDRGPCAPGAASALCNIQTPPQSQPQLMLRMCLDVIEDIMSEPLFDELRTQRQLGYNVECATRMTYGVAGYQLLVCSCDFSPGHIVKEMRLFLQRFRALLAALPEQTFAEHIDALVSAKLERDTTMVEETDRHFGEMLERRFDFRVLEAEARALRALKLHDVVAAFDAYFAEGGASRHVATFCVCGGKYRGIHDLSDMESMVGGANIEEVKSSVLDLRDTLPRFAELV